MANTEVKKTRKRASGPRKVKPVFALVGVNSENGKIECVRATRDAGDLLETIFDPSPDLKNRYGDSLNVVKVSVETAAGAAAAE